MVMRWALCEWLGRCTGLPVSWQGGRLQETGGADIMLAQMKPPRRLTLPLQSLGSAKPMKLAAHPEAASPRPEASWCASLRAGWHCGPLCHKCCTRRRHPPRSEWWLGRACTAHRLESCCCSKIQDRRSGRNGGVWSPESCPMPKLSSPLVRTSDGVGLVDALITT
jgi:hypothetical protein